MSEISKVQNAIILLGSGRSGTTLLAHWLSLHPDLAWISNYNNALPAQAKWAYLNRLNALNIYVKAFDKISKLPKPAEAHQFWDYYFPNPLIKTDQALPDEKHLIACVATMHEIINVQGKKRLMTKMTGPCRWPIFKHVFDSPKLIWIERDPIAVLSSMMKLKWFFRNNEQKFEQMSVRDKINFYAEYLEKVLQSKLNYPADNLLTVRYEDIISDPIEALNGICEFATLSKNQKWLSTIEKWQIKEVTAESYHRSYTNEDWNYLNNRIANVK